MRLSVGLWVLIVVLAISGAGELYQVAVKLGRSGSDPFLLALEQGVAGALAALSIAGIIRRARWASGAVAGWALAVAILLGTLPPMLSLPAEARPGIWGSAVGMLGVGIGASWYVRRAVAWLGATIQSDRGSKEGGAV